MAKKVVATLKQPEVRNSLKLLDPLRLPMVPILSKKRWSQKQTLKSLAK